MKRPNVFKRSDEMEKAIMRRNSLLDENRFPKMAGNFFVNIVAWLILTTTQPALAQTPQKTFASARQASEALYNAVQNKDEQAVQSILGRAELTSSGNDTEDRLERERFAKKYSEMHRLVREADGSVVLYLGAENWPFPIPLVASDGKWRFDSDAGSQEILARTIGENETVAIEVCKSVGKVDGTGANATASNASVNEFIQNLSMSKSATAAGELFDGYYFRVLPRKANGLVVVAYPAEYRSSGVVTFVVRSGAVYERDLGPQTAVAAQKIEGKPTGNWSSVK